MSTFRIVGFILSVLMMVSVSEATVTTQSASSQVDSGGTTQVQQGVSATDGFASSQAIWPTGPVSAQARTAARSRSSEIAANALVYSDTFSQLQVDLALSQAFYAIDVPVGPVPLPVALDFFLPPSYIEIAGNAELQTNVMEALFFADLRVCQSIACSASDSRFFFQVDASGSFREFDYSINVSGDPTLDLTPLETTTVQQTDGFVRTYLIEFPDFMGHLDLTDLAANQPLRVEYTLQARASGLAVLSSAIAAINDPFVLDSDPVRQGSPIELTIVPEPASWSLCVLAAVILRSRRRLK